MVQFYLLMECVYKQYSWPLRLEQDKLPSIHLWVTGKDILCISRNWEFEIIMAIFDFSDFFYISTHLIFFSILMMFFGISDIWFRIFILSMNDHKQHTMRCTCYNHPHVRPYALHTHFAIHNPLYILSVYLSLNLLAPWKVKLLIDAILLYWKRWLVS